MPTAAPGNSIQSMLGHMPRAELVVSESSWQERGAGKEAEEKGRGLGLGPHTSRASSQAAMAEGMQAEQAEQEKDSSPAPAAQSQWKLMLTMELVAGLERPCEEMDKAQLHLQQHLEKHQHNMGKLLEGWLQRMLDSDGDFT